MGDSLSLRIPILDPIGLLPWFYVPPDAAGNPSSPFIAVGGAGNLSSPFTAVGGAGNLSSLFTAVGGAGTRKHVAKIERRNGLLLGCRKVFRSAGWTGQSPPLLEAHTIVSLLQIVCTGRARKLV
mmetsp:Transcript_45644/g.143314  ORF Transcript_45644/g.143314 Transcript_45644/m.143314 type:complete len:125 (-) Transcript_45644:687-1061(-)